MPNIDAAFGLRPYRMLGSGANTHGTMRLPIQTSAVTGTSSPMYQGSPVIPLTNGMIDIVGNANGGTVPLLGAFLGCEYVKTDGTPTWSPYWPGTSSAKSSTAAWAHVLVNPDQLYLINCDAAAADGLIHANANFATATSGSTTTGISSAELAVSTAAVTNTLNLRIMGFEETPANSDAAAAGRLAIVMLVNHFYRYSVNGTSLGIT